MTETTTRPGADAAWTARAQRLSSLLAERGDLRDDAWKAAVAAVPRHRLVPAAYRQDTTTGAWRPVDIASDEGMELVYSPETLITALEDRGGHQVAASSSTKPDLMLRMLEVLDVHNGHRVLEIGTGTGYNAALLSHRLGQANVFSVDIDSKLVDAARRRLAEIGYHPTLAAVDGVDGLPEHAPYDRIIATCSVPTVPWSWARQLAPGGRMLVDLKVNDTAGNLVDLRRLGDRAEGRFTARWATFMTMRHHDIGDTAPNSAPRAEGAATRVTTAPPQPWWSGRVVWFLAQFALPAGVGIGMRLDPDTRQPTAGMLSASDGSWARIELAEHDGLRQVTEAGPTPLWAAVERAHQEWTELGEPDWPRLGVTVTHDRQWAWLDDPAGPRTWPISATVSG
ncbi:MAG: methyltransferase domain-containing protein [Pseudonocardiaceae bacterium]